MNTIIRLKIKKDIDTATEKKILKLKGYLIAQSFTDLIHYDDEDEDNYTHYFTAEASKRKEIVAYIVSYIHEMDIAEVVTIP